MAAKTKPNDAQERRFLNRDFEVRFAQKGDEQAKVATTQGYACLFDNVTSIGGYWQERFAKGAFGGSMGERDVVALHSHDDGRPMGRMSRDTLRIEEDDTGLRFENDLPDTQDGRDLATSIDRGDIEGMSFRFRALKEEWDETQDPPMRTQQGRCPCAASDEAGAGRAQDLVTRYTRRWRQHPLRPQSPASGGLFHDRREG